MAESYFNLSNADRRDLLTQAAHEARRLPNILEKDIWVVWCLEQLFGNSIGEHLVFKGGTSLSKAFGVIDRFSEDVDLTYDIRTIAPDFIEGAPDGLPPNPSQRRKWSDEIEKRLVEWTHDCATEQLALKVIPSKSVMHP